MNDVAMHPPGLSLVWTFIHTGHSRRVVGLFHGVDKGAMT